MNALAEAPGWVIVLLFILAAFVWGFLTNAGADFYDSFMAASNVDDEHPTERV